MPRGPVGRKFAPPPGYVEMPPQAPTEAPAEPTTDAAPLPAPDPHWAAHIASRDYKPAP